MRIKFYGSRGSSQFSSKNNIKYGGNTSCVKVNASGRTIIIDCGSGLAGVYRDIYDNKTPLEVDILLSHLHLDHIIGLSAFPPLFDDGSKIRIFTESRNEKPLKEQVFGVFKPPYWPIDLGKTGNAELIEINSAEAFWIGTDIKITPRPSAHPDKTTAFRLEYGGKSVVYLLDSEIPDEPDYNGLAEYCRNADVIIFDSAYMPDDYAEKRGWGHSAYTDGVKLAEMAGCKKIILAHFSQNYSDEDLDALTLRLEKKYIIARDDMEFMI